MQRRHLGFSSFAAPPVRQRFYSDAADAELLGRYAQRFGCYEMPWTANTEATQVESFMDQAPAGLHLLPTHPGQGATTWESTVTPLLQSRQCGPILVPWAGPWSPASEDALDQTLDRLWDALPASGRVAVEFRDASWFRTEPLRVLSEHEAGLVWSTRAGIAPYKVTADFLYVRITGHPARQTDEVAALLDRLRARSQPALRYIVSAVPSQSYGVGALERLARRIGVPLGDVPASSQAGLERYAEVAS